MHQVHSAEPDPYIPHGQIERVRPTDLIGLAKGGGRASYTDLAGGGLYDRAPPPPHTDRASRAPRVPARVPRRTAGAPQPPGSGVKAFLTSNPCTSITIHYSLHPHKKAPSAQLHLHRNEPRRAPRPASFEESAAAAAASCRRPQPSKTSSRCRAGRPQQHHSLVLTLLLWSQQGGARTVLRSSVCARML